MSCSRPLFDARRQEPSLSVPEEPVWLEAGAARLEQVPGDLLNNTAKDTGDGGRVWLSTEPPAPVLQWADGMKIGNVGLQVTRPFGAGNVLPEAGFARHLTEPVDPGELMLVPADHPPRS